MNIDFADKRLVLTGAAGILSFKMNGDGVWDAYGDGLPRA